MTALTPTDANTVSAVRVPRSVLIVAMVWLAALIACFILYERDHAFASFVAFKLGPLPFEAIWFGAVGGLLISAQGIFKNNYSWKSQYNYWHYARPIFGAIMGTLGCLIFIVLNEAATKKAAAVNPVFYDVIALAIGYREESFRGLLTSVIDTILVPTHKTPNVNAPQDGESRKTNEGTHT